MTRRREASDADGEAVLFPRISFGDEEDADASAGGGAWRWVLVAILALAFLVRLVHFIDVARAPLIDSPVVDGRQFFQMADEFARGKFIGDTAYQKGPLYPFLLAFAFHLPGDDLPVAIGLQLLSGVLVCYLVFRLGRSLFGTFAGLVAAAWTAVYRPLVFFEGQLLAAWLAVLLTVAFLMALTAASQRVGRWRWGGAGLLLGLAILVRGNLLLLIPFGLVWILWLGWRSATKRAALAGAGLFLLGSIVPVVPVTFHNYSAEGEVVLLTSTAGVNLYTGNREGADGYSAIPVHSAWEIAMDEANAAGAKTSAGQNAYWTRKAIQAVRQHPGGVARLLVKKVVLLWDAYEYPNNLSFDFSKRFSRVLRLPFPGFGALATLALTGLVVLGRRARGQAVFCGLFLLFYTASVLPFFACDRYRMPMIPALLCLAGGTSVWIARRFRERAYGALGAALVPLLLIGAFVNVDLLGARPRHFARDWVALGDAHRYRNRLPAAAGAYARAIEADPEDPDPRALMGGCLYRMGERGRAEESFREALRLRPEYVMPRALLARLLFEEDRLDESVEELRYLAKLYPGNAEPYFLLGQISERTGDLERAIKAYGRAASLMPELAPAHHALARLLLQEGMRVGEALEEAETAARIEPGNPVVQVTLSEAREAAGDLRGALIAATAAERLAPGDPAVQARIANLRARVEGAATE